PTGCTYRGARTNRGEGQSTVEIGNPPHGAVRLVGAGGTARLHGAQHRTVSSARSADCTNRHWSAAPLDFRTVDERSRSQLWKVNTEVLCTPVTRRKENNIHFLNFV
ncbi:Delta(1)-pyrroline-2-carboxylate/Delta(1)-piperideine-2-carboxylate reductase, partial [Frankliniella fusca]